MTILKILRVVLLSLYWDFGKHQTFSFVEREGITRELNRKKEKKKQLKKQRNIPKVARKIYGHRGYLSTRSKDVRFSQQRKLRRMYRNS